MRRAIVPSRPADRSSIDMLSIDNSFTSMFSTHMIPLGSLKYGGDFIPKEYLNHFNTEMERTESLEVNDRVVNGVSFLESPCSGAPAGKQKRIMSSKLKKSTWPVSSTFLKASQRYSKGKTHIYNIQKSTQDMTMKVIVLLNISLQITEVCKTASTL